MKKILIGGVAVLVLGVAFYGLSPLFRHTKVDEALPAVQEEEGAAPVIGTTGHPAAGTARIVTAEGKRYVRYENFKTINGPDIYVYLAKDLAAHDFVNLGPVRATEGNINYEIPDAVNIDDYPYVLTWCKTFGVLFNSAKIRE